MPPCSDSLPLRRVLMLHGAGGGGWEWNRWRPVFEAAGWRVDTPELQPAAGGISVTGLDDYLGQLREGLSRKPVDALVGASLGGLLCLAAGDSVARLPRVLVNPLPPLPEAAALPPRAAHPEVIGWSSQARFRGTHDAMPDSVSSARLFAYRHWRDESGRALNAARAGIPLPTCTAPCLVMASEQDRDVPVELSAALALRLRASLLRLPGDHLAPLLGDRAHEAALHAVAWLNTLDGFRSN